MKLKFYKKYRILLIQEVLFRQWFWDREKFITVCINPATKQEENPSVWAIYVMSGRWSALSKTDTNNTSTPITNNMSTWGLLAISLLQYYQTKIKKNLVKYDRRKSILVLSVIWPIPLSSPTDNNTAFNNRKKLLLAILGSHFIWANIEA